MYILNGELQYKPSTFIFICEVSGELCFHRQLGSGPYYYVCQSENHKCFGFINPWIICKYVIVKNSVTLVIKEIVSERIPCSVFGKTLGSTDKAFSQEAYKNYVLL